MIKSPLTDQDTLNHAVRRSPGILVTLLIMAVAATLLFPGAGPAQANIGGVPATPEVPAEASDPAEDEAKRDEVLRLARRELSRRVSEYRSNNVPRYRDDWGRLGRGKRAPYGFQKGSGGPWCVAFATWTWGKAGFDSFRTETRESRRPKLLRTTFTGETVAVQVNDLRDWAKKTKRWTLYATPGDLIAYGSRHIGVVTKVNEKKRAIWAIEGNLKDRVKRFEIPMEHVKDYISPEPIPATQQSTRSILRPHVG